MLIFDNYYSAPRMAEDMSMADDEVIEELSTLLEVWENEKDTASFDPDPLLLRFVIFMLIRKPDKERL